MEGVGERRAWFWSDFSSFLHADEAALHKCSDPYKTLAGAAKIKVFHISRTVRASLKTIQNRSKSLSNRASHKDHAKNWSEGAPGSSLDGSGALLVSSWLAFGRSWAFLEPFWALLGRSWARLGSSLSSPGWSVAPLGCILASRAGPGLDFWRFWDLPGWVLEGFGRVFSAAPRYSLYNAFIDAETAFLRLLRLSLLPFWCGGLCAAHPPPPVGRAGRVRS